MLAFEVQLIFMETLSSLYEYICKYIYKYAYKYNDICNMQYDIYI